MTAQLRIRSRLAAIFSMGRFGNALSAAVSRILARIAGRMKSLSRSEEKQRRKALIRAITHRN